MRKPIYVTMPTLAPLKEVNQLMESIWESGIMTHNGPLVQRFEKEVCAYLNVPQMVSCCNGTLALQMAVKALGRTGEIITSPFTFIATISSIMWEHCTPVFVDIDPETLNIDPKKSTALSPPKVMHRLFTFKSAITSSNSRRFFFSIR